MHADSTVTTADMINMMNGYRTGIYGYSALVESPALDSCAQWTAETMASLQATGHLVTYGYSGATARCSSSFGFGGGKTVYVTENWAMHRSMTLDILAGYWSDSAHMLPATSAQYTYVGAGIASANGETYYVLQAGNISGETAATGNGGDSTGSTSAGATSAATADTSQYMDPVITSTPNYDGYIYHTVKYGQTLFDIALAYGITLDYLKTENGLTSDSIYEGQSLKIMQAPTATITPTATSTPIYPTRTPTVPVATYTPLPLLTATPTPVPSLAQELPPVDRQTFGLLLVILSALGLAVIVFFTFFKPAKPAPVPVQPETKPVEPEVATAASVKKKRSPAKAKLPETEIPAAVPAKKKQPKTETVGATPAKKPAAAKPASPAAEAPVKKPRATKKKTQE